MWYINTMEYYLMMNLFTDELIYKTEIDPQTQKTNLWLPKGERGRDKLGFGINRYTLLYIK